MNAKQRRRIQAHWTKLRKRGEVFEGQIDPWAHRAARKWEKALIQQGYFLMTEECFQRFEAAGIPAKKTVTVAGEYIGRRELPPGTRFCIRVVNHYDMTLWVCKCRMKVKFEIRMKEG